MISAESLQAKATGVLPSASRFTRIAPASLSSGRLGHNPRYEIR